MSRRRRTVLIVLCATAAAIFAALVVGRGGEPAAGAYGPLRQVVVLRRGLSEGRELDEATVRASLSLRRIPSSFVPAGALTDPSQAVGLRTRAPMPAGTYLLASQLGRGGRRSRRGPKLARGRHPVEITVTGAGALSAASAGHSRVDVLVTTEPGGAGPGRTYVAAAGVLLLAVGSSEAGDPSTGPVPVTLALDRRQAIRLVQAESFARRLTVVPGASGP